MKETWIDSHCHLQQSYIENRDLKEIIAEALDSNVVGGICIGTDYKSSKEALELAQSDGSGFILGATIGVHPHEAKNKAQQLAEILNKDNCEKLVAIGECGLDYYYMHSPKKDQLEAFEFQLDLASKFNLTVVVHTRDAFEDTCFVIKNFPRLKSVIIHCFTGDKSQQARYLDMGFYISYSGIVTFQSALDIQQAAMACPIERMLIETDSPFLTPVPFRGKPNEPKYVEVVGRFLSELKKLDPLQFSQQVKLNTFKAFGLKIA
jgi:TatD DNase family protein